VRKKHVCVISVCLLAALIAAVWLCRHETPMAPVSAEECIAVGRPAKIKPDYTNTVIPPNIAPLNFVVLEPGTRYQVTIRSRSGEAIRVLSKTSKIQIPLRPWRALLGGNRGEQLFFDVYVKGPDEQWQRYETIANKIAAESIDSHIAYRLITPIYNYWRNVAVYQRNLENFDESTVFDARPMDNGCVNCHSFLNNNPDKMILGIRTKPYGSSALFAENGKVTKLSTKFGHTAWHPSGRVVAYSLYDVRQIFHLVRPEVRDVMELDSSLAYYLRDAQSVKTDPVISDKHTLETHPTWGPQGRYLYYASAPMLWADQEPMLPPAHYDELQYDLLRVSYDLETDRWGEPETVLSARDAELSILFPRISPDGRFALVSMCQYSCFPSFQPNSDLYLIDLTTRQPRRLDNANSEQAESWHSWSSNNRWIAFSSKRPEGIFSRVHFSYIDESGKDHKAFIMPQKDPTFYDSFVYLYNLPELITGPVTVSRNALARAVRSHKEIEVGEAITGATKPPPGFRQRE